MTAIRHFTHLVTRFLGVLGSKRLTPPEQDLVNGWLTPRQAALFWQQQAIDQRHAFEVAARVSDELGDHPTAVAAALLHDVGKRHSGLGAIGRSLATVAGAIKVPMPSAWRVYLDHEALGAADLAAIDADPLVVAFAAGKPAGDEAVWATLVAADDGRIGQKSSAGGPGRNTIPPEVSR